MAASDKKFAIVVSRYNQSVTQRLLEGAISALKRNDVPWSSLEIVWVPGAYEIPLAALKLAQTRKYSAVICLGCVMKGETLHNHYISESVAHGLMRIQLSTGIPVTFGVLTPNNQKQALARSENNSANKGTEAAEAAFEMVELLGKIKK
jgi:6,7-dimethyl-8-ribityllumazine synthase